MSASQSNGLMIGNYLLLGRRIINQRQCNIMFTDNYTKYFKRMNLERYEMTLLSPFLYTSDPLVGLDKLEPITMKQDARC